MGGGALLLCLGGGAFLLPLCWGLGCLLLRAGAALALSPFEGWCFLPSALLGGGFSPPCFAWWCRFFLFWEDEIEENLNSMNGLNEKTQIQHHFKVM